MKRSIPLTLLLSGCLAIVAVTTQAANAEDARTAVPPVPQTQSAVQRTPQPAVSQPSRPAGEASGTVELSVFEVRADSTDSYEALNTTSITGTAKNLSQLPITAEIFTAAAMRDHRCKRALARLCFRHGRRHPARRGLGRRSDQHHDEAARFRTPLPRAGKSSR